MRRLLCLIAGSVLLVAPGGADAAGSRCHGERVTVRGTDGDDSHLRIRSGDVVGLGDGDDFVFLRRADDVKVCGGQGEDTIYAGTGVGRGLVLDGEDGTDTVGSPYTGGPKAPTSPLRLFGGEASDNVSGGRGADLVRGGNGVDLIDGGGGSDRVEGESGSDRSVAGGPGKDLLLGGKGDDNLFGNSFERASPPPGDRADCGAGRDFSNVRGAVSCEARDILP